MNMNDYETVALVAGGHTFGKSHGACPDSELGPGPEGARLQDQGFGYNNPFGAGKGEDATTSGIEGSWTSNPTQWDTGYLKGLFELDWEKHIGPGGKWQWKPKDPNAPKTPDAFDSNKTNDLMMMTTDIALVSDPEYRKISKHFCDHPDEFAEAFTKAWYKLTHRDMGPVSRLIGPEVPEAQIWQDLIPAVDHLLIDASDIQQLKKTILGRQNGLKRKLLGKPNLSIANLVRTAWASASTFRRTDYRGGANGARIRFEPQKNWEVNDPKNLAVVLEELGTIQSEFNAGRTDGKKVSLADLIVLGGCAAIEEAARNAGMKGVEVPFTPGRMDASSEETDTDSFKYLEPQADAFRNFVSKNVGRKPEEMMVDRASLLGLDAPEMTVLIGGMRALGANADLSSDLGILTANTQSLTNDFFVNLLDMSTAWKPVVSVEGDETEMFIGIDRVSGKRKWSASRADLIVGHNSELRAIAEYYACSDSQEIFVRDFIAAWTKVMDADRRI